VNIIAPGAIETDFGGGEVRDNAEVNRHIAAPSRDFHTLRVHPRQLIAEQGGDGVADIIR
jgi:hypothetical protein